MRRLLQPIWFLLALIFLIEAWLWDHLVPAIRLIVAAIPLRALKRWLSEAVDGLSPPATLVVFLIPATIYFALELVALWPMAYGRWLLGLAMLIGAKIIGAAITAFTFDVTRTKLLELDWFRNGYQIIIGWRDTAHRLADPYLFQMRKWSRELRLSAKAHITPTLRWLRRKAQAVSSRQ
jgi:hypothetical protein